MASVAKNKDIRGIINIVVVLSYSLAFTVSRYDAIVPLKAISNDMASLVLMFILILLVDNGCREQ